MELSAWEKQHLESLVNIAGRLEKYFEGLIQQLVGERVQDTIKTHIDNAIAARDHYHQLLSAKEDELDLSAIYGAADKFARRTDKLLTLNFFQSRFDASKIKEGSDLVMLIVSLAKEISEKPSKIQWTPNFVPTGPGGMDRATEDKAIEAFPDTIDQLKSRANDLEAMLLEISRRVESRFEQLSAQSESEINSNKHAFEEQARVIQLKFDETQRMVQKKSKDLDVLVSAVSGKVISNVYVRNAIKEQRIADRFRNVAVFLMVAVGLYVAGSVLHMEYVGLASDVAVVRIVSALFFTFVIAYLIRQSAVHRGQQHRHMQTGLDLLAIGPYMADLPKEVQSEIRRQVAEKIFVPKEVLVAADQGSFGSHEIATKLLDKLELPKKG